MPLNDLYSEGIALYYSLKLLHHSFFMGFCVASRISKVVHIITISRSIDLHCLQERDKFFEIRLAIYTKHVLEKHCASANLTQAKD